MKITFLTLTSGFKQTISMKPKSFGPLIQAI